MDGRLASRPATGSGTRRTPCAGPAARCILPPPGTIAAVDVRGGAPGRARPESSRRAISSPEIHALVFAGGSAFGLAAASRRRLLARANAASGSRSGPARVPIVAGAVLFDLGRGRPRGLSGRSRRAGAACDAAAEPARSQTRRRRSRGPARPSASCSGRRTRRARRSRRRGRDPSAGRQEPSPRSRPSTPSATSWIPKAARSSGWAAARTGSFSSARALARRTTLRESPLAGANTTLVCVATDLAFRSRARSERDGDRGPRRARPGRPPGPRRSSTATLTFALAARRCATPSSAALACASAPAAAHAAAQRAIADAVKAE